MSDGDQDIDPLQLPFRDAANDGIDWLTWRLCIDERLRLSVAEAVGLSFRRTWEAHRVLDALEEHRRMVTPKG